MSAQTQTRELFKKLPQKMRDVIISPELAEIFDNIAKSNNLDKNQKNSTGKAVIDFLMGINNKEGVRTAILKDVDIDAVLAEKIFSDIENKILNNIDNVYNEINKNNEPPEEKSGLVYKQKTELVIEPQKGTGQVIRSESGVGQSFEQIILSQAKAMMPAKEAGSSSQAGNSRQQSVISNQVPENLPTEQEKPRVIHNYIGNDPYREATE